MVSRGGFLFGGYSDSLALTAAVEFLSLAGISDAELALAVVAAQVDAEHHDVDYIKVENPVHRFRRVG